MPDESEVVICTNPKCHRKMKEPILLNILSTTPVEQYHACPHCFTKLDGNIKNYENITQESTYGPPTHPSFLEKVLDTISAQPKKEKENAACPQQFGYLANRPKRAPIPGECLVCLKVLDCAMKKSES